MLSAIKNIKEVTEMEGVKNLTPKRGKVIPKEEPAKVNMNIKYNVVNSVFKDEKIQRQLRMLRTRKNVKGIVHLSRRMKGYTDRVRFKIKNRKDKKFDDNV